MSNEILVIPLLKVSDSVSDPNFFRSIHNEKLFYICVDIILTAFSAGTFLLVKVLLFYLQLLLLSVVHCKKEVHSD